MSNLKKKLAEVIAIFIFGLACLLVADLWDSAHGLKVNEYTYATDELDEDITVVVISDLHEMEFGEGNQALIEQVTAQSPDLIFMLGDMMNEDSTNPHIVFKLIERLLDIAPVYFAPGNHELMYMKHQDAQILDKLQEAGAIVLEMEYADIEVKGSSLRIGGFYGYAIYLDYYNDPETLERKEFLTEFLDTDRLTLMLSHRPDSFVFADSARRWDIDLVLSGHLHGGQIVLPFLGGVYGGDQGWFPEYVHGLYQKDNMHIFVTSGLGTNPQKVPRINNLPEIAVICIEPE